MERRTLLVVLLVCSCVVAAAAEASPSRWPSPGRPRPFPGRPKPIFRPRPCNCYAPPCPCDRWRH
uniref:Arasin 1 n=1 Tax=Hyas araneus TaxID=361634 RepID=ARA1_HYAAR|nr:RecName: Full=Arasin 1; Short=Ara-1; AltName: Full=Proline-rich antimicrobial peptide; Short=PR-AMP; Short=Pro-rich AMP; Flags: Precursor [Hyas araneus]ABI74601.1 arasin-1 [Hyas araneus]